MNSVDYFCGNIICRVESECEIRTVQIIVDCFGQSDHIQAFLAQKVRSFVCSVSAQRYQAVEFQGFICLFHCGYFIHFIFPDFPHIAERSTTGSQYGSAKGQNSGKLFPVHFRIVSFNQSAISVMNPDDFRIKHLIGSPGYAADSSIQTGAVPAAGQDSDSSFHFKCPFLLYIFHDLLIISLLEPD